MTIPNAFGTGSAIFIVMIVFLKRIAEFIVFRNVFISIAAVCLVAESRLLSESPWQRADALMAFTFFSTFLVYNFHSFSNDSEAEFSIPRLFRDFINPAIFLEQRICVGTGIAGTLITFLFLEKNTMLFLLPLFLVTIGYSLPLFNIQNRMRGLRDIVYVKIITVAFVWAVSTTFLPYLNSHAGNRSLVYLLLLFAERFLFIYAITLPFEIRDRHSEKAIGNKTVPIVYGVGKAKSLGYILLIIYCLVVLVREFLSGYSFNESMKHFLALFLSAVSAALLLLGTNDTRNRWYYKFLIDGTIVEQFLLLILFSY